MKPIPKLLSKTKLLRGYRCLKCIYLTVHHPEFEAPITPELQALFDQGNRVGAKAREYFPGGILIDNKPWDFFGAIAKTRELIATKTDIIYEAAFEYAGCYARADIIQYSAESKRWSIFEVKSSTKAKPEHLDDVGLQAWIMAKSGLPIERIHVVHLNPECCYPDLSNLFKTVDITDEVREKYLSIQPKLHELMLTLKKPNIPDINIGDYCSSPTECGFISHCWQEKNIPEISVFNLPGIKNKKWDLYYDGIVRLDDPELSNPNIFEPNELQARVLECFKTGQRFINREAIASALADWKFPLIFLDFETINPAIPRYHGCHPFEQLPFQFSVHTWQDKERATEAEITHTEFLHDNSDDPRPSLIPALLQACGEQGSIVAYYGKFEAARIQELADYSPEHRDALLKLIDRIVDPLPIIREAVYDNAFAGSFSLKSVAPALLGDAQSYDGMMVANGGDAQRAFEELISENISAHKKASLKQAMIEYCKKDTFVMVELAKWLYQAIQKNKK
jgi:hypothetical protein